MIALILAAMIAAGTAHGSATATVERPQIGTALHCDTMRSGEVLCWEGGR